MVRRGSNCCTAKRGETDCTLCSTFPLRFQVHCRSRLELMSVPAQSCLRQVGRRILPCRQKVTVLAVSLPWFITVRRADLMLVAAIAILTVVWTRCTASRRSVEVAGRDCVKVLHRSEGVYDLGEPKSPTRVWPSLPRFRRLAQYRFFSSSRPASPSRSTSALLGRSVQCPVSIHLSTEYVIMK